MCKKYDVQIKISNWKEVKNIKSSLYVMGNINMPGIYKIGYVNRKTSSLADRTKEETRVQWVTPDSLRCLFVVDTDCPELLENKMHEDPSLTGVRISGKRELFQLNIIDIFNELVNHAKGLAKCIHIIQEEAERFAYESLLPSKKQLSNTNEENMIIEDGIYESTSFGQFTYKNGKYSSLKHKELKSLSRTKFCIKLREYGYSLTAGSMKSYWFRNNGEMRYQLIKSI